MLHIFLHARAYIFLLLLLLLLLFCFFVFFLVFFFIYFGVVHFYVLFPPCNSLFMMIQVAAGYVMYGSATLLVYATSTSGVNEFTLDPST